jgi:hypothetical protein
MMSFTHGAPTFYHLDIIEDRSQPAGAVISPATPRP